jgi:transcriptional regulator with XRE-family HTH domain
MNYYNIKLELEKRGIAVKDFCRQINLTEQGFYQMIRNESMRVDVLERISDALKVPVSYWFDTEEYLQNETVCTTQFQKEKDNHLISSKHIDTVTAELNKLLKDLNRKRVSEKK